MARLMGPTWGPPGTCRPQMGPMLDPWTLLSGMVSPGWLLFLWIPHFFCLWSCWQHGRLGIYISLLIVKMYLKKTNMYLYFIWFLRTEEVDLTKIISHGRSGPVLYSAWLNKVLANERCYICNVFSNWLKLCSAIHRAWAHEHFTEYLKSKH